MQAARWSSCIQGTEFDHGYAPYEMHLNAMGIPERVVDERAPVALLDPQDPLLSLPNRITEADFDGWAEERGHSFMSSWGPEFAAPTETHDSWPGPSAWWPPARPLWQGRIHLCGLRPASADPGRRAGRVPAAG